MDGRICENNSHWGNYVLLVCLIFILARCVYVLRLLCNLLSPPLEPTCLQRNSYFTTNGWSIVWALVTNCDILFRSFGPLFAPNSMFAPRANYKNIVNGANDTDSQHLKTYIEQKITKQNMFKSGVFNTKNLSVEYVYNEHRL